MPDFIYWAHRLRDSDGLTEDEKKNTLAFTYSEFRQILSDWSKEIGELKTFQVDKKNP